MPGAFSSRVLVKPFQALDLRRGSEGTDDDEDVALREPALLEALDQRLR